MARILSACYQLAFTTPGITPDKAISLKQILHNPKRRRYPRCRPQRLQRLYARVLYLGFLLHFSIIAFLATNVSPLFLVFLLSERHPQRFEQAQGYFIGFRSRADANIKPAHVGYFIAVDFHEHDLFLDAEGIIAVAVE
jgi:hypothetical protein